MKNAIEGVKQITNTLTGDAREYADAVVGALEQLEADAEEHDIDEIVERLTALAEEAKRAAEEKAAETEQAVAEKIQKLQNMVAAIKNSTSANIADKFTMEVRNAIAMAVKNSHSERDLQDNIEAVLKKNDITGLSYTGAIDYAIALKQEDNDELYAEMAQSPFGQFFVAELDPENASNIAKQWPGLGEHVTEKDIQELAVEGKTINTKEIYKRQRVANATLDDAEDAGQLAELEAKVAEELKRGVQGLVVRAALIGDTVNAAGKRVSTFETIGTKTSSDLFTTVIAPAGATPDLIDLRKASMAVKYDYKIAVMTAETKLALINRKYSSGATPILLSDEELAAQIGVDKVYTRDFIGNVEGLHAIVFNPREYWVRVKKERAITYPQWEKNVANFQYELNCGGAIHGLESSAIVKSAGSGSSSK